MKKIYRNIMIVLFALGVVCGVLTLVLGSSSEGSQERTNAECLYENRVFDEADKLTDEEETALETLIAEKEEEMRADFVLVTISDASVTSHSALREMAETLYEAGGFGWDQPNGDGFLYIDNWATGQCYMCTTGTRVRDQVDDETVEDVIIEATNETVNEDPAGAYTVCVETTADCMQGFSGRILCILVALILTAIFLGIQLYHNKGKDTTTRSTYVPEGGMKLLKKDDVFLHSHVTRVRVEHDHDHSGGGGGGGGHGGGGGSH